MRTGHSCLIQHILLFAALLSTYTQAAIVPSMQNSPSWIVQPNSFAMVVFSLAVGDVKNFLPAGVNPQLNEKGKVTATLEVYNTEQVAGMLRRSFTSNPRLALKPQSRTNFKFT